MHDAGQGDAVNAPAADPGAALARLLAWGLPGAATTPVRLANHADAGALADLASAQRVTGPVLSAIADGGLEQVPRSLVDELGEQHLIHLRQSLMAENDLVFAAGVLSAAGVEFRVLKGCAAAHLDYTDPALRTTSDVDLLVRRGQFSLALEALSPHTDWTQASPEYRPGWTARWGKARTLRLGHGWLDLHRMIADGYWGMVIDEDSLFAGGDEFEIAGVRLCGLGWRWRLQHSLLHAANSNTTAQSKRDAVVLASAHLDGSVGAAIGRLLHDPTNALTAPLMWRGLLAVADVIAIARLVDDGGPMPPAGRRTKVALRMSAKGHGSWTGALAVPPWNWPGLMYPIVWPGEEYSGAAGGHRARLRRVMER